MSRIYSTAVTLLTGTAQAAIAVCDLESSAVESPSILAIDVSIKIGVGNSKRVGFGRSSNTPVSSLTQGFAAQNPNDPACTSAVAMAWSTAPAVPAAFNRMFSATNSLGQYVLFTFPAGLKVLPSSSYVLWDFNQASGQTLNYNVGWEIEL